MGKAARLKAVPEPEKPLRLDLGCGQSVREGFIGVDKYDVPGVTHVVDLFTFPWPFASNSVTEVWCAHVFEHIPGPLRGQWMDELYRILKPAKFEDGRCVEGFAAIIVPYAQTLRAVQDYSHQWPPVCETSFLYFNKGWREAQKLTHGVYDLTCDFDFTYGKPLDPYWQTRNEEQQRFAAVHHWNATPDLHVQVTKRGVSG